MIALHSFGKRFYAIFFCFHVIFCRLDPELRIYWQGVWFPDKFESFYILQILILKLYVEAIIVSSGLPSVELSIMYFKPILKLQNLLPLSFALNYFFGQASVRSYKIGVVGNNWFVGWLIGWLVTLFSQKRF